MVVATLRVALTGCQGGLSLEERGPVKTRVFLLVAAVALCAPSAASAATVPVQQLNGAFGVSNNSVTKTPDGVHFGVYADAGRTGGSLIYKGANGLTLGQLSALRYTYTYTTSASVAAIAAPYLNVILDANGNGAVDATDDDVIFDPSLCGQATPAEDEDHAVDVTTQTVRYDDDSCGATAQQTPFATVQAEHPSAPIIGIWITQGFSGGNDASAFVRSLTVNADTFVFDVPPVGAPGAPGTTTIVRVPVVVGNGGAAVLGTRASSCRGDDVLTLRVARRSGARLLSARATLLGKRLKVRGRSITVDLRGRARGRYDVRVVARYRTNSGRVVTRTTHRVRSVACS